MKKNSCIFCSLVIIVGIFISISYGAIMEPTTFCNPVNIDYRFTIYEPVNRMAADPVIVLFKDDYYLFASNAGGYWYSSDLYNWTLVETEQLPVENMAPAVFVIGDKIYFTVGSKRQYIYSTDAPKTGIWQKVSKIGTTRDSELFNDDRQKVHGYRDDDLFLDDDGRVYMYHGCSRDGPIYVVELGPNDGFKEIGPTVQCLTSDYKNRGWERFGDENLGGITTEGQLSIKPWIEGPWMTKYNGVYYLQYSAPGTEFRTYADGLFTSVKPTGPFIYAPYSPVSHKPTGFVCGAGHGSTFKDKHGNYWRIVTMTVSVAHIFERRIGIFPAGFDKDGQMFCNTYLGDYPQYLPGVKKEPAENNLTGWMLLSFGKKACASSSLPSHPVENAFDENIRTYWSATSAEKGQWLEVDLEKTCQINAVQVNFAEHNVNVMGRDKSLFHQYIIEASSDRKNWDTIIDKSSAAKDVPHDYIQLDNPVTARFVRLTNIRFSPPNANFSVRGLRIFGKAQGQPPQAVNNFAVRRNPSDQCQATIIWEKVSDAEGFIVRYGIGPGKLYNNYQVYGNNSININSLNSNVDYYFTVDSFNSSGITKGAIIKSAPANTLAAGPFKTDRQQ